VIDEQDDREGKEGERREDQVQRVVHDKTPDPLMVLGALQDVADQLVFEERNGQLHQLDQVIGDQRDVDPCGDVEQQPIAHCIRNGNADNDHDIGDQHDVDKADVAGLDPHIDDRFRDKREETLKGGGDDHHGKDGGEVLPERCEIADHVFEGLPAFVALFAAALHKVGHGFDGKERTGIFARFVPSLPELVWRIGGQSFGGIGDMDFVSGSLVHHDKMGLLPMYDAGQRDFCVEVLEVGPEGEGVEADLFSAIAEVEKGDPFACDAAQIAQVLKGVVFAKVFGNHLQAGGTAVHGIQLVLEWKAVVQHCVTDYNLQLTVTNSRNFARAVIAQE